MVVRIEEAQVTVDTLAGTAKRRADADPGIGVMADGTSVTMDFTSPDKGWGNGDVAAHAVGSGRSDRHIFLNPGVVVVIVVGEVGRMALDAGAALAVIKGGIAIGPNPAQASVRIVAGGAGGLMDHRDSVSDVTVGIDAGSGFRHRGGVAVLVLIEIPFPNQSPFVTLAATMTSVKDVLRMGPVDWIFQERWRSMAISATAVVNRQRVIGDMAGSDAGRIVEDDA